MRAGRVSLCAALVAGLLASCDGQLKRFGYDGFGRDDWQKPDEVIAALGLRPGDRVADLGAGGGYFTFRLAEAVGDAGQVLAVDIDPDMTTYLEERARNEGTQQVRVVLTEPDDAGLPPAGLDLVFTSNTYHHLQDRPAYFARVRESLAPGGRVAIVELTAKSWFARWFDHHTEPDVIREEMESAGYALERAHAFLPRQSFLVFRPAG